MYAHDYVKVTSTGCANSIKNKNVVIALNDIIIVLQCKTILPLKTGYNSGTTMVLLTNKCNM